MKHWMSLLVVFVFLGTMTSPVLAANVPMGPAPNYGDGIPDSPLGPVGPAPYSGDGDPDGSGMDRRNGQNDSEDNESPPGPAPNSGDGIPDGSGF